MRQHWIWREQMLNTTITSFLDTLGDLGSSTLLVLLSNHKFHHNFRVDLLFDLRLSDVTPLASGEWLGSRPILFNLKELIHERDSCWIYSLYSCIAGLTQINKIDMFTPQLLVEADAKMFEELNSLVYFKYIFLTVFGKGFGDRIRN
jgi:hypothetical protein